MRASRLLLLALLLATLALPVPAEEEAPALDFAFYKARVAPIVHGICAECHADPRKRLGRHLLRPAQGRAIRERDHERNFETIRGLVEPGNPAGSVWLLKPLGPRQGGVEHGGGERVRMDSLAYGTMVDFINGSTLPRAPGEREVTRPPPLPLVPATGLAVSGGTLARTQAGGAEVRFRIEAPGVYRVDVAGLHPDAELALAFDDGPLAPHPGPALLLDGDAPLSSLRGTLDVEGEALSLWGRVDAPSAFLLADPVPYAGVEAEIELLAESEGGEDALLCFDAEDASNGFFLAILDGGRRLGMGVIEGGVRRVLRSARLEPEETAEGRHVLRVDHLEGVAIGRLDGSPRVFLPLSERATSRRVGLRSRGRVRAKRLTLHDGWVVHETAFRRLAGAHLPRGEHRLRLAFTGSEPPFDTLTIRPLAE